MDETLRAYNLSPEEAISHLRNVLGQNRGCCSSVRIRCVCVESQGKWQNAICFIDSVEKDQPLLRKAALLYPRIHFLEDWIDASVFSTTILDRITNGFIPVNDENVSANVPTRFNEWEYLPSKNKYSKYPGYLYKSEQGKQVQVAHHSPLLAYNLPFYPNPYLAIREWMDFREFHMRQDATLGTIQVFLPQFLAYFTDLTAEHSLLKITVKTDQVKNLRLKGAWEHSNGCTPFEVPVTSSKLSIAIPDEIEGFEVYLVCPSAYSDPSRPLIPTQVGHPFRRNAATDSDRKSATFSSLLGIGGRHPSE